jgi:hypothetical protein
MERRDTRPPPFEGIVNGSHASRASISPVMPRKKRVHYSNPPIWALRHTEGRRLNAANYVIRKVSLHHVGQPNGKPERLSRHASPEERRSLAPGHPAAPQAAPSGPPQPPNAGEPLGPWEPCITGTRPFEELNKTVADFLFVNVVHNPDLGEITSRGVQFEIEAKLGTLISKDTNDRIYLPITSETVLHDNGRVTFRSSMTEVSIFLILTDSCITTLSIVTDNTPGSTQVFQ